MYYITSQLKLTGSWERSEKYMNLHMQQYTQYCIAACGKFFRRVLPHFLLGINPLDHINNAQSKLDDLLFIHQVSFLWLNQFWFFGYCYQSDNIIRPCTSQSDHIKRHPLYMRIFRAYFFRNLAKKNWGVRIIWNKVGTAPSPNKWSRHALRSEVRITC